MRARYQNLNMARKLIVVAVALDLVIRGIEWVATPWSRRRVPR